MIPGEYPLADGEIELNEGLQTQSLSVATTGDRPIQVGSHTISPNQSGAGFRPRGGRGFRLNIAAGTAVPLSRVRPARSSWWH